MDQMCISICRKWIVIRTERKAEMESQIPIKVDEGAPDRFCIRDRRDCRVKILLRDNALESHQVGQAKTAAHNEP